MSVLDNGYQDRKDFKVCMSISYMANGKRRLLVEINSFDPEIGDHVTNHMATFSISYHNLNQVKQILRKMYDHPETKYHVKLIKVGQIDT